MTPTAVGFREVGGVLNPINYAPEGFDSICSLAEGEFAASFPVSAAAGVAG